MGGWERANVGSQKPAVIRAVKKREVDFEKWGGGVRINWNERSICCRGQGNERAHADGWRMSEPSPEQAGGWRRSRVWGRWGPPFGIYCP